MTPNDIIKLALKKSGALGVGQIALAEDVNDALSELNMMIAQWRRKRWLVYQLVDLAVVSTGKQSYTIGPAPASGLPPDIVVSVRPDRLEDAYIRLLQPVPTDTTLDILEAREDYDKITLKQLMALPTSVFYDPGVPWGTIYPIPVPNASIYELHVIVKQTLASFTSLAQQVTLPEEYNAALVWCLAQRIRPNYGLSADPQVDAIAADALGVLRKANTQISRLTMPSDLMGATGGIFNVYSGRSY